jgi:transcriptional regulator with XRE-family HTH domain
MDEASMSAQIRSDRLREAMARARLSAKALARRTKARGHAVSERAIARYCQGEAAVHGLWPHTLLALAKALDVEEGYLTGEAPDTAGEPAPSKVFNETLWRISIPTRIRNFYQPVDEVVVQLRGSGSKVTAMAAV